MTNFGCVNAVFEYMSLNTAHNVMSIFTSDAGTAPTDKYPHGPPIGQKTIINILTIFQNSASKVAACSGVIVKIQDTFSREFKIEQLLLHVDAVCDSIGWTWTLNAPLGKSPYNAESYLVMMPESAYKGKIISPTERTINSLEMWAGMRSLRGF